MSYDDIAECAAQYASARDRISADTHVLADYQAVLRARVALAECLLSAGWTPPQRSQHLLTLDRQLLAQPNGSIEALDTEA